MTRVFKHPKPLPRLHLVNGMTRVTVVGWQSSHALAIYRNRAGYASAMMLSGLQLAGEFKTLAEAHEFNRRIVMETKLRPGEVSIEEVVAAVGGMEAARQLVEQVRSGHIPKRKYVNRRKTPA